MEIVNSYIFIPKIEERSKSKTNDDGTISFTFSIQNISSLIANIFELSHEIVERVNFFEHRIPMNMMIKNDDIFYNFHIHGVDKKYYVDIVGSGNSEENIISGLEVINKQILDNGNILNQQYFSIVSYDSVSEYYCNLVLPNLNNLERKLRKLLFNIYTLNFGKEYYSITIPDELQEVIKANIQAKGGKAAKEQQRIREFFYSLEYRHIIQILFKKNWTGLEENIQKELIKDECNDKLTKEKIAKLCPRSDWDRFFADKIQDEDIAELIKQIGQYRNKVAHFKFFYFEDYGKLIGLVNRLLNLITEAIEITETEDFIKNNEKSVESVRNSIFTFMQKYQEDFKSSLSPAISQMFSYYSEAPGIKLKKRDLNSIFGDDFREK